MCHGLLYEDERHETKPADVKHAVECLFLAVVAVALLYLLAPTTHNDFAAHERMMAHAAVSVEPRIWR